MSQSLLSAFQNHLQSLASFAGELRRQVAEMGRRGQRGFRHNIQILETWLRGALLEMAQSLSLPAHRKRARQAPVAGPVETSDGEPAARRAGFRAILPDDIDRQLAALKRPVVDMAALAGPGGSVRRDMRPVYLRQLAAIDAVLKHPERYARRVRRTLDARAKRPPMRLMQVRHRSARSDLMRVSPNSDLGRQLWYYDTS